MDSPNSISNVDIVIGVFRRTERIGILVLTFPEASASGRRYLRPGRELSALSRKIRHARKNRSIRCLLSDSMIDFSNVKFAHGVYCREILVNAFGDGLRKWGDGSRAGN